MGGCTPAPPVTPGKVQASMTVSELNALLDAHDVLVKAYVDSSLTFAEFVSAYGDFPHSYGLDGQTGTAEERVVLQLLGRRVAFHLRVSSVVSGLRSADDPADIPNADAGPSGRRADEDSRAGSSISGT
jgi:hypothetical protein